MVMSYLMQQKQEQLAKNQDQEQDQEQNQEQEITNSEEEPNLEELQEEASKLQLRNTWVLWSHEIRNKRWTIDSYNCICEMTNVAEVCHFLNTFPKLDMKSHHYFLMKKGVQPTWEDPRNRNGGVCSLKTEIVPMSQKKDHNVINVWNYLVMRMTGETCHSNSDDLTGLSLSPKNNWAIIKIWNSSASNDLSRTLPDDIRKRFSALSIKYKANAPEY